MENNFQFSTFHFPLFTEFFQHLPALVEASGEVETAFPLTALQREKHFAAAVEVAEPFRDAPVSLVAPGAVVGCARTTPGTGSPVIALYRGDEGLEFWSHSSSWGGQPLRSMKLPPYSLSQPYSSIFHRVLGFQPVPGRLRRLPSWIESESITAVNSVKGGLVNNN